MHPYWQKQSSGQPLFPDIEWNRPEQKSHAGKLAILGGNKLGFLAVATAYQDAVSVGAGQVRVILPDVLKSSLPSTILDASYIPSNPSGGMSKDGDSLLKAACSWADHVLIIGDTGRNSETAILLESLIDTDTALTITRDSVDMFMNIAPKLVDRPRTTVVLSFAQLQKLFQSVYYPKMLSFSMQLSLLVETLHKFTVSYPVTIATYHQNQLIIAQDGSIVTQEFDQPMMIWRGTVATRIACYQMWSPKQPLEAASASIASL